MDAEPFTIGAPLQHPQQGLGGRAAQGYIVVFGPVAVVEGGNIAIGSPPLLPSSCENSSQSGFSPASHRACDFHRTRRSINAD